MSETVAERGARSGSRPAQVPAGRSVIRRRGLPNGRAVVGGFLVALAALGTFAAYTRSTAGPSTAYVVAARDLPAGRVLTANDLQIVPLELPDAVRARAFDDPGVLLGAITVAPLQADELVQASAVAAADGAARRAVSFSVETSRAVAGSVQPGELIDVLVTFGGDQGYTDVVLLGAPVLGTGLGADGGEVGGGGGAVTFTVEVPDLQAELALTHAAAAGTLTVARSTGLDPPVEVPGPFVPRTPGS